MVEDADPSRDLLRRAGLSVTGPRQAVLGWLSTHPHATAEDIGAGVAQTGRRVSKQAIYDVLTACTRAGLVRRIEPAGHPARYERRTGDNHHHLLCRSCGRITDADCVTGETPCLSADTTHGYRVEEAEVMFWGICPFCTDIQEQD